MPIFKKEDVPGMTFKLPVVPSMTFKLLFVAEIPHIKTRRKEEYYGIFKGTFRRRTLHKA